MGRGFLFGALALCLALPAYAQVDENALFGGGEPADAGASDAGAQPMLGGQTPAPEQKSNPPSAEPAPKNAGDTEQEIFAGRNPASTEEQAPADPLKLGGLLYMRTQMSAYDSTPPKQWGWSMPNLLDVYFDGRPNSRVRAFVSGRLSYDPTIDPNATSFGGEKQPQTRALLDQMWINFDIERTVFVTAGKQHVKWGTGRFWNPTDYLQPVKLNPLAVFDERTGVTMVKANLPWESRGWNLYAMGVFQGNGAQVSNTVENVGGAARAEIVLGDAELGLDTYVQHGRKPKFGADLSSGLGPLDVRLEAALHGADSPKLAFKIPSGPVTSVNDVVDYQQQSGIQPQLVGGADWQVNLNDRDALTLGGEFFYNALGYGDDTLYPLLIATGNFQPFYVGRYYAGAYGLVMLPRGRIVNTFLLSTLGNLSDGSYISRLDYNVTVLTHLRIELFGDVHYGSQGGEFRFGFNSAAIPNPNGEVPQVVVPTPLFDAGVALRVSL